MTFVNETIDLLSKDLEKKYKINIVETKDKLILALWVFSMSRAAKESPVINAVIDSDMKNVTYREYVDIIVPIVNDKETVNVVIRNAESKSYIQIFKELLSLNEKVKSGKLFIEDLVGGTLSVNPYSDSLVGLNSIEDGTTCKVGLNKVEKRPYCVNNNPKKIEKRDIMMVSLTYDHRLIDGREGVLYLRRIKEIMENPLRLFMEV